MFFTIILLIVILSSLLLYLYIQWSEQRNAREYARRNVPYVLPQRNALLQVITRQRPELVKHELIQQKGNKVFGFNFLGAYTILVAEPELAQMVFSKEFINFGNRRVFQTDDPIFANNISIVSGEQWKRLRSIISPTFTTLKLRRMKPLIDDTVRTMIKNINDSINNHQVNMKQIYDAFTMDTIIQIGFGIKVNSLTEKDNPIIEHARGLLSMDISLANLVTFTLVFMTPRIANALNIKIKGDVTSFFNDFSMKIIENKRREMMKENYEKANSFIELLLEAEIEEKMADDQKKKKFITNDEIVAQCVLLFLAGYDSTATAISMVSYHLALNPEVQEKLYFEIVNTIDKLTQEAEPDGTKDPVELITMESLSRFEYLNAVVLETLRLNSPATFAERVASKDIVMESQDGRVKINVKKGDIIQFPIYSMHRDPEQWPEPEKFKPERFIGEPKFHKYSYLPFGAGPRNCVAKSLALVSVKLAILNTVRQYKLSVCSQTKIPPEFYYQTQVLVARDIILNVQRR